jgi:N-acetyl-D-muramate 6-phosphate phosphatase
METIVMTTLASPHLAKPNAILFDLDGTLADTAFDLGGTINEMRVQRNLQPLDTYYLRKFASRGAKGLIGAGFNMDSDHAGFIAYQSEFLEKYTKNICKGTVLFDGVIDVLNKLNDIKMPWGIITNKATRFTLPLIKELQQKYQFPQPHVVVCGDTTAYSKPHPEPMLYACECLDLPANQHIWYVGDDIRDMHAAKAANMTSIAAAYGYLGEAEDINTWQADAQIQKFVDVLSLM